MQRCRRDVDGHFAHHFRHINVGESRLGAADVEMERREIEHISQASASLFEERADVLICQLRCLTCDVGLGTLPSTASAVCPDTNNNLPLPDAAPVRHPVLPGSW